MLLGLLTLITALSISAVAIYYSVAGLVAIFAAAALPIMVMGGTLEIAKLVTAVWLHRYWKQATWWLKSYLSLAVVVLMFITSMGIFGFLSKAHIEQTSASQESVARVEQLEKEIARQIAIVGRAENEVRKLESTGTGSDANIQAQIDAEQERIDRAYERIQPAINEQQRIIDNQGKIFRDELARLDEKLATLQGYIDAGGRENIQRAQQMVGARADGAFGPNTAQAFRDWQSARQQERAELLVKIEQATNNPQARAAANEIKRLRQTVETQIAESNKLINRLRANIGKTDNSADIQKAIDEQNDRIRTASNEVDRLTEEKYALEAEYRKLEAEVGPIKYIAEFVYGDTADTNMLEEAVRWVIIVIIFVFDPLAVLLLIASQYTFEYHRRNKDDNGGWLRQWREYEQARAQRIVDNPGFTPSDPSPSSNDDQFEDKTRVDEENDNEPRQENTEEEQQDAEEFRTGQDEESISPEATTDTDVVEEEASIDDEIKQQIAQQYSQIEPQKKSIESLEELKESRTKELEVQDTDATWSEAKRSWKEEHPDETLKKYKDLYVTGVIDKLPWEDYRPKNFIAKEGNVQVRKETVDNAEGYIQNAEQSESSLWKKIQNSKPE